MDLVELILAGADVWALTGSSITPTMSGGHGSPEGSGYGSGDAEGGGLGNGSSQGEGAWGDSFAKGRCGISPSDRLTGSNRGNGQGDGGMATFLRTDLVEKNAGYGWTWWS